MRALPAMLLTVGIIASLTSCAGNPFAPGCDAPVLSGDASDLVSATGAFGSEPTVDFPTPLVTKKVQRTELLPGDGSALTEGETALIDFTILDGTTGDVVQTGDYGTNGIAITIGGPAIPAVSVGLHCATVGSRVAIVSSAKDAGQSDSAGGASDSLVFVIDIVDSYPAKASGTPQIPQAGLPAVVTAPNGAPGITVPNQEPPSKLTVAVLQQGNGKTVKAGDDVVTKYTALVWDGNGKSSVFDSTWTKGEAVLIPLTKSDTVTEGFAEGLAGQKVGSQVLLVVPPAQGYGDVGSTGVPPGSTLIYVVDILGIAK